MSSSHAKLSAAADERKARLAKLRSIKRKQPDDEIVLPESERVSPAVPAALTDDEQDTPDVARLHLSGRNYDPEARGVKLGFEAPPNLVDGADTLEAKAANLEADLCRQQEEEDGEHEEDGHKDGHKSLEGATAAGSANGIDLFKLQPKKPNWDLKRELNKRLEPLDVRTNNAISKLVRERLMAKQQTGQQQDSSKANVGGDEETLEGAAMVESIRIREHEAEEEERREREAEDEQ